MFLLKEFKDSVSTIVSVARYSDGNYKLFQQIASEASDEQKSLNQKVGYHSFLKYVAYDALTGLSN